MSPDISKIINYSIIGITTASFILGIILIAMMTGISSNVENFQTSMLILLKVTSPFIK